MALPSNFTCGTFCLFSILLSVTLTITLAQNATDGLPCSSPIYCSGEILKTMQFLRFFNDSKYFVDLPLRISPSEALDNFAKLGPANAISQEIGRAFLNATFLLSPESDLLVFEPKDWKPVADGGLSIHANISDEKYRTFAEEIHKKWKSLGRQVAEVVKDEPDRHSLIYVPHPFIVPGGRFRETYYWDSFWVIQGLLVSGMTETVKGMILNFAYLIDELGHMPNGNRVYYEKRSQPPFLALMVEAYIEHPSVSATDGKDLIALVLPSLEREYSFWMTSRTETFWHNEAEQTLNVYKGGLTHPRPESYREDFTLAENLTGAAKEGLYANLGAGGESGWDFSSRWLDSAQAQFSTIRTQQIVPVDLNAVLCAQERLMADFYNVTGNMEEALKYRELARIRGNSIHAVFWNESKGMWRDYDLKTKAQREDFYLSHIVPLFARCSGSVDITTTAFMHKLLDSDDLKKVTSFAGGFPASLAAPTNCQPHCQWDFPNAWPPLQMMLIEGFAANPDTRSTALEWAQKMMTAVYTGFQANQVLYEKYDATNVGAYGGGGEYVVQEGFGWTNGGILRLLELFKSELRSGASSAACSSLLIMTCFSAALLLGSKKVY